MKHHAICLLCAFILSFSGCASQIETPAYSPSSPTKEMSAVSNERIKPDVILPSSEPEVEKTVQDTEDVWEEFTALYHADSVFSDLYIKEKYLFIGDESIVQLLSIAGYEDAVVFKKTSVERVKHTTFDGLSSIEIFDKTNRSVSIMTTPEEATAILELLQ